MSDNLDFRDFTIKFSGIADSENVFSNIFNRADKRASRRDTNFGVKVFEEPESLRIDIYEKSILGDILLSNVYIGIPDSTETVKRSDNQFSSFEFTGVSIQNVTPSSNHMLRGALNLNVGWGEDGNGNVLGPKTKRHEKGQLTKFIHSGQRKLDPLHSMGPTGVINLRKLMVRAFLLILRVLQFC